MRVCRDCGEVKREFECYAGTGNICKGCWKGRMKKRRQENPAVQAYERERAKLPHRRAYAKDVLDRWRVDNPEKMNADRARNPEAARARTAVGNAVRDGRLFKKPCAVCGTTEKITAHHEDYSKPLDVVWLCAQHHADLHPKWHRPYIEEVFSAEVDMLRYMVGN